MPVPTKINHDHDVDRDLLPDHDITLASRPAVVAAHLEFFAEALEKEAFLMQSRREALEQNNDLTRELVALVQHRRRVFQEQKCRERQVKEDEVAQVHALLDSALQLDPEGLLVAETVPPQSRAGNSAPGLQKSQHGVVNKRGSRGAAVTTGGLNKGGKNAAAAGGSSSASGTNKGRHASKAVLEAAGGGPPRGGKELQSSTAATSSPACPSPTVTAPPVPPSSVLYDVEGLKVLRQQIRHLRQGLLSADESSGAGTIKNTTDDVVSKIDSGLAKKPNQEGTAGSSGEAFAHTLWRNLQVMASSNGDDDDDEGQAGGHRKSAGSTTSSAVPTRISLDAYRSTGLGTTSSTSARTSCTSGTTARNREPKNYRGVKGNDEESDVETNSNDVITRYAYAMEILAHTDFLQQVLEELAPQAEVSQRFVQYAITVWLERFFEKAKGLLPLGMEEQADGGSPAGEVDETDKDAGGQGGSEAEGVTSSDAAGAESMNAPRLLMSSAPSFYDDDCREQPFAWRGMLSSPLAANRTSQEDNSQQTKPKDFSEQVDLHSVPLNLAVSPLVELNQAAIGSGEIKDGLERQFSAQVVDHEEEIHLANANNPPARTPTSSVDLAFLIDGTCDEELALPAHLLTLGKEKTQAILNAQHLAYLNEFDHFASTASAAIFLRALESESLQMPKQGQLSEDKDAPSCRNNHMVDNVDPANQDERLCDQDVLRLHRLCEFASNRSAKRLRSLWKKNEADPLEM
ncbi:unnamed protein product [Amoebophrya sp. A120]|nr:unnamed protein product [Amoebophrya sp. A120]|eukprot:GSA120T00017696001.1